ncbi:MAG TPA: ABC transporter ATP-binding protein [Actinocrinis sp.]|nr:ABC transporter ATP-binding protein [Actinocrinis sp.]
MRTFPVPDPGQPDTRSAARYLSWLTRNQWRSIVLGAFWGVCWMVSLALVPAVLGRAIDAGIAERNSGELVRWSMVALALGAFAAVAGVNRHRNAMANNFAATYRTTQILTRHIPRIGATLPKVVAAGDVVTIGVSDITTLGAGYQEVPITLGAVSSICVVSAIMLNASVSLGLTVILGVPALMVATGFLTRPLHRRQSRYRDLQADLTTRATDIAAGLRVLRGIGGEQAFAAGYRASSQAVRTAGVQVARIESLFDAVEVLAPGAFAALVTWLAATFAVRQEISIGSLVAFYGYATFLTMPLTIVSQSVDRMTSAYVASGRVVNVLRLQPAIVDQTGAAGSESGDSDPAFPPPGAQLADEASGLASVPGGLLAVVCADSADAGPLAERLARFADTGRPTLGGVPLDRLPLLRLRTRILLARNEDRLFRGPLSLQLSPPGRPAEPEHLLAALRVAGAEDILAQLDQGLDTVIDDGGRNFSGGQQQRLRLARVVAADPETLILVEPTSAVDAHTEARIAERLAGHRAGRSTIVFTSSPLLLDRADSVSYLEAGVVVASGTHRDLLDDCAAYRAVVTRGED